MLVYPLCRILGFRRAPLVVGRYVNLRTEIKPVATDQLLSTFLMQGQYLSSSLLLFFFHTFVSSDIQKVRVTRYCVHDFLSFDSSAFFLSNSDLSFRSLSLSHFLLPCFFNLPQLVHLTGLHPAETCLVKVWHRTVVSIISIMNHVTVMDLKNMFIRAPHKEITTRRYH